MFAVEGGKIDPNDDSYQFCNSSSSMVPYTVRILAMIRVIIDLLTALRNSSVDVMPNDYRRFFATIYGIVLVLSFLFFFCVRNLFLCSYAPQDFDVIDTVHSGYLQYSPEDPYLESVYPFFYRLHQSPGFDSI